MIGILPAAGNATRINGLPKFLLPIPDGYLLDWHERAMRRAGVAAVYIGANAQTYPILCQYAPEATVYVARAHETMSETVLSGYDAITEHGYPFCLFGMPDTYWTDDGVYTKLAFALAEGAQLAVALFLLLPGQHRHVGCVDVDGGRIVSVADKPEGGHYFWGWGALAWKTPFWSCIRPEDAHVGFAIPRAIEAGLDVRAVRMDGEYHDCGTTERYFECIRRLETEHA